MGKRPDYPLPEGGGIVFVQPLSLLPTAALVLALGAQAAVGQSAASYLIEVSGEVSPANPVATVDIWATWDQPNAGAFVLGDTDYDVVAAEGLWLSAMINPVGSPVSNPGTPAGSSMLGARFHQFHIPSGGMVGDPANPLLIWRGEWTTTDFNPRSVSLFTENTTLFRLVDRAGTIFVEMYPGDFTAGSGQITVVPVPHTATCLIGFSLALGSRRRSRVR